MEAEPKTNIEYFNALKKASDYIKEKVGPADIAMILGSGLGDIQNSFSDVKEIPYSDIPYMPVGAVPGQKRKLVAATYEGKRVILWSGRIHRYEGFRGYKLLLLGHLSAFLGCQYLLVTCASGGA